jgi:putative ABC transport system permease protein
MTPSSSESVVRFRAIEAIGSDLRYSFRTLMRQRGLTAVAVLTLAVALAANTAIFSVVDAILLRPLPFAHPAQLVNLGGINRLDGGVYELYSYPNYRDLRTQSRTLAEVVAFSPSRAFLMEGDEPELIDGIDVTANLPAMLGVSPQLGRFFTTAEDEGAAQVMVISHELWQRRFGGDPTIIGRGVRFGSSRKFRTVVGVMPARFRFPADAQRRDYFTPFHEDLGSAREERDSIWITVVATMRNGVTLAQANAELKTIAARLEREYPKENVGLVFRAQSMHEKAVRNVRPALLLLFGAVGVVLLIGCANVANLLLARATARHKEISIRAALGASRMRIATQLLTESVILSLLAGVCGLLLAWWGIDALLAFAPPGIPRLDGVSMEPRVLVFTLFLSMLTGIAFGLAPALAAARPDLTEALNEGTRGSTEGGRRNSMRNALVVAAIALSLMLLSGAGLLLRSFIHVTAIDPGYDHRHAVALALSARTVGYPDDAQVLTFQDRLMQEIRALPGVESVAASDALPLTAQETIWMFGVVGHAPYAPGHAPSAKVCTISPRFFRTLHIPLLRGRDFTADDRATAPAVAIVNQAFVREFFPNGDAVGQKLRLSGDDYDTEVVGVSGDVRWRSLTQEAPAMMFFPLAQRPRRYATIIARANNTAALAPAMRSVVRRLDREQPIVSIGALSETRTESLATRRFTLILLTVLALVALVLAAAGIFSVMSYAVTQRSAEIGIRMALGADAGAVVRLIVGHAARLVAIGTAVGVAGALLSSKLIESLLYGVPPTDPWTFAAMVMLIAATALAASYIPARRAASVDPLVVMR